MKIIRLFLSAMLLFPLVAFAQGPPAADDPAGAPNPPARAGTAPPPHPGREPREPGRPRFGGPKEMGQWWKNSDLAQKLTLSDAQIKQLDQIFFEHRMKLIDDHAELEKQDLKLEALLDEDSPNEAQVGAQVDQELSAKSKLEREFTMMNLALRKVLSVEQWRQLKTMREDHRGPQGRRGGPDGGPMSGAGAPPPD